MLDLCTLGTGGTMPMPDRALAALYTRVNGRAILIDCGEGTQVGVQKLGWGMQCIDGSSSATTTPTTFPACRGCCWR